MKICAVLACFNRRVLTLACLDRLNCASREAGVELSVIVVDDASTDGTAAAVRERFPSVQVVEGPGNLFWNRGMHLGLSHAMRQVVDYLLWLNDDTMLHSDALLRLLRESVALQDRVGKPVLLVGATADDADRLTYGGSIASSGLRRFSFQRVWSADHPVPCEVINGNCVLVPWALAQVVGNVDPIFEHAMGDTDYALRARLAGFQVYVASGIIGTCTANSRQNTFKDGRLGIRARWRDILDRKGLPWRSWLHFTRRHGGLLWPVYFVWPYVRVLAGRSK